MHSKGVLSMPINWEKVGPELLEDDRAGAQYWVDHAARGPALKPMGKPCHDCAVVLGFYKALSDELAEQPCDIREKVCGNWFCHNNPTRACAGNIENVRAAISSVRGGADHGTD
jgi:hypothetical protein